jgi:Tfp pilus assembly protein PilF
MESGIQLLESWLQSHPDDNVSRHKLAQGFIATEKYDDARKIYEALRADGTEDVVLLNNLASVYQRLGDKRALSTAELAYKRAPEVSSVLDTYGWILIENDKPEDGLALLREAFARFSTGPEIRYHIGLALLKIGKVEEAAEEIEAALDSNTAFTDIAAAKALLARLRP